MRRAVVHVNVDPGGRLSVTELERAVTVLRGQDGFQIIASDLDRLPPTRREIELLRDGDDPDELRRAAEAACAAALSQAGLATTPKAIAVSFVSFGTADDALGVVRAFGLGDEVEEIRLEDDNVAVIVLTRDASRHAIPANLATALEAALNRELRFTEPSDGSEPSDASEPRDASEPSDGSEPGDGSEPKDASEPNRA